MQHKNFNNCLFNEAPYQILDLERVGAYPRWLLIKFSQFSAIVINFEKKKREDVPDVPKQNFNSSLKVSLKCLENLVFNDSLSRP